MQCPLLCKEFIIDAWQIYYARTKGADAILLIAAILPDLDIKYMTKICKMLGLAALVEVRLVLSSFLICYPLNYLLSSASSLKACSYVLFLTSLEYGTFSIIFQLN
ncbi:hypothetical protein CsSME_00018741 [Camellia sinensis var. sinensis]